MGTTLPQEEHDAMRARIGSTVKSVHRVNFNHVGTIVEVTDRYGRGSECYVIEWSPGAPHPESTTYPPDCLELVDEETIKEMRALGIETQYYNKRRKR